MASFQSEDMENTKTQAPSFRYQGVYFPLYIDKHKLESNIIETFPWREDDVVVTGHPKSGTTWVLNALQNMQEFGLMGIEDCTEALYFEWFLALPDVLPGITGKLIAQIQSGQLQVKSPRLIRSHLPRHVFPWQQTREKKVKIIYITRNPKDVCVSVYHHLKKMYQGKGLLPLDWDRTVDEYIQGRVLYGPWLQHVIEWNKVGIEDNVLHLTYEGMKYNFRNEIQKIGRFLQINLSDGDVDRIERVCTVHEMRKSIHKNFILDKAIFSGDASEFVRKGVVGDWKNHFSVAQNERINIEIVEKLKENGINLQYC